MGSSCPVCGRFWRARGCTPGDCKGTPEPVTVGAGRGTGPAPMEYCERCSAIMRKAAETAEPFRFEDLCQRCQTIIRNAEASRPEYRWSAELASALRPLMTAAEIEADPAAVAEVSRRAAWIAARVPPSPRAAPPTHFAGVAIEDFCAIDRERIERMAREGKIGIAGMCASCSAKVDAATPAAPPLRHPPPWHWEVTQSSAVLVDDIGQQIILLERDYFEDASPRVRALIELVPDLDEFARDCANGDAGPGDVIAARASELLARIAERSKGGR